MDILSSAWLKAIADQSQVKIPEHISTVFEVLKPITQLAIKDHLSKSEFQYKSDGSPAGEADVAIENLLRAQIKSIYPTHYFTGEETGSDEKNIRHGDIRWLIDPIDGTRNNEYGRADFAISIACQKYEQNAWRTIDALLAMPLKGEVLWAGNEQGTYALCYNPLIGQEPEMIAVGLGGKTAKPLEKSLIDLSIKPLPPAHEGRIIQHVRETGITHRTIGSAAIAVANVGSQSDGAIVLAYDYDVAAGAFIAERTGAIVSEERYETEKSPLSLVIAGCNENMHSTLKRHCDKILVLDYGEVT